MIGTTLHEYVFIKVCIFVLQYATPLCLGALALLCARFGLGTFALPISSFLIAYSALDALYYLFIWVPHNKQLKNEARHPPPPSPRDRRVLFDKVINHITDFERYLGGWFLGADVRDVKRDNVRDFVLWAFFDTAPETATEQDILDASDYVDVFERKLGRKLEPGRGNARGLRLTLDAVETRYRTFSWFLIVGIVDFATHVYFSWHGFQYHAQPRSEVFSVYPPRLQSLFARKQSASKQLGYWYRPHTASDKVPVVFLHGIGIGLYTYAAFLARLSSAFHRSGDIGVIAIEILPVSFRMTNAPMGKLEFLDQLNTILDSHGWSSFVLTAHSYGSVLASHMVHSPTFASRIHGIVLTDPVSIMLHLPDVAYNFTRRKPKRANEWQLWYFASMDPGVAHALGRHFFWSENIIWKEELLTLPGDMRKKRNVAVCLAERDLIVDTVSIARYLADDDGWVPGGVDNHHVARDGIEILWFPGLDHGQMFDSRSNQDRLLSVVQQSCLR